MYAPTTIIMTWSAVSYSAQLTQDAVSYGGILDPTPSTLPLSKQGEGSYTIYFAIGSSLSPPTTTCHQSTFHNAEHRAGPSWPYHDLALFEPRCSERTDEGLYGRKTTEVGVF